MDKAVFTPASTDSTVSLAPPSKRSSAPCADDDADSRAQVADAGADPVRPVATATSTPPPVEAEAASTRVEDDYTPDAPGHPLAADEPRRRLSVLRIGLIAGSIIILSVGGLTSWLGLRAFHSHQKEQQRELFAQVGRQGALNLTTIDWQHADSDVKRILDSATDAFYDDFSKRSGPFIELVKQSQVKTVSTVTESGLESADADKAQVLVALSVQTSNAGVAEQIPRAWRMRIFVHKVGDQVKVSNVEFVT